MVVDLLNLQQQILEMLSTNINTSQILSKLCLLAESLLPNSVASIMLKNKEDGLMSIKAAPSIPQNGQDRLANLKPGPTGGSCGNAVFKNLPQFVKNTFTDKRWAGLKEVAIDFNICSCWSFPIRDKEKNAIGSFALSSFEHRSPNKFHKKLLETASSIVSIVLANEEIQRRNRLFSIALDDSSDGIIISDEKNQIIEINDAVEKIYGYKKEELIGKNPKILSSNLHDDNFYENMWEKIKKDSKWSGEIINRKKDNLSKLDKEKIIVELIYGKGKVENSINRYIKKEVSIKCLKNEGIDLSKYITLLGIKRTSKQERSTERYKNKIKTWLYI